MSAPLIKNIQIVEGDTLRRTYTYKTSAGAAIDLTGFVPTLTVRTGYGSATTEMVLTEGDGITFTPLSGQIVVNKIITMSVSEDTSFVYDLKVYHAANEDRRTLVYGRINVMPRVG